MGYERDSYFPKHLLHRIDLPIRLIATHSLVRVYQHQDQLRITDREVMRRFLLLPSSSLPSLLSQLTATTVIEITLLLVGKRKESTNFEVTEDMVDTPEQSSCLCHKFHPHLNRDL
jgi:hypothetical protein